MIGAFLVKPKTIELRETTTPEPKRGEVRIRLQKVGICGSDVHLFLGHRLLTQPTIIGHEAIGMVDKTESNTALLKKGDRVVIEPNIPCKKCRYCISGRGNICINKRIIGVTENGCFAEFINMPEEFCWKIPDAISDDDAVTIEPAAVAYHALSCSSSKPNDAIAILGLGAIGLLITQLALKLGYKVFVIDINETNLQAATAMGAIALDVSSQSEDLIAPIADTLLKNNVTAVFECAGADNTASFVLSVAPRGSEIILVGLSAAPASFIPLKIVREGIRIIPSIIYNHPNDFEKTIQLVQSKILEPGKIISGTYKLAQLQLALEAASSGKETKLIITI
jgi:threonine dehydrogenase-like Zn-dependent dehydrogenase